MSELIIQSGKLQGKRLVLPSKEMVVGRDEDCDLRIASSLVSRKHCVLKASPEGILVTDLASQNGTHVNDVPITEPTLLREGDMLRIGSTLLAVPSTHKPKGVAGINQQKVSDAEIADWLTDSGSNFSGSDTAVIATYPPTKPTPDPAVSPNSTPALVSASPTVKSPSSKVLSVKDEAAAVIRKHWEAVKAKQKK